MSKVYVQDNEIVQIFKSGDCAPYVIARCDYFLESEGFLKFYINEQPEPIAIVNEWSFYNITDFSGLEDFQRKLKIFQDWRIFKKTFTRKKQMPNLKDFMSKYTSNDYSIMNVSENIYFVYDCVFKNVSKEIKHNCNCAVIDFSENKEGEIHFYENIEPNLKTICSYKHYQIMVT